MKTFYFEDENGIYLSERKTRRFKKMIGKEAYDFLKEEAKRGIRHRFMRIEIELPVSMNNGVEPEHEQLIDPIIEKVFIEVRPDQIKKMRKGERREQYVSHCVQDSEIKTVSFYALLQDYEELTIEETVALPEESVEDLALHEIELEVLRLALQSLSNDELRLVHALFLSNNPLTERELAEEFGVTQPAINQKKKSVIKKLKKYLETYL